jgi:hypothetical protein
MYKLFFSDKFGFASNIWACLTANITMSLQVTTTSKKQNLLTNFFAKNKPVESTDYETGLPDATLTEA